MELWGRNQAISAIEFFSWQKLDLSPEVPASFNRTELLELWTKLDLGARTYVSWEPTSVTDGMCPFHWLMISFGYHIETHLAECSILIGWKVIESLDYVTFIFVIPVPEIK